MTKFQKVEPWELLNLAFMPREEALEVADRYAAQLRDEQAPNEHALDATLYLLNSVKSMGISARGFVSMSAEVKKLGLSLDVAKSSHVTQANNAIKNSSGTMFVKARSGRKLWNARCISCKCETPVYLDSNRCPECD